MQLLSADLHTTMLYIYRSFDYCYLVCGIKCNTHYLCATQASVPDELKMYDW